jgi:hypothetical protein
MGQTWWKRQCRKRLTLNQRRNVLTTALFILSTRSMSALQYLLDNPGFLLQNCTQFGKLYDHVCVESSFFGLHQAKSRNLFTSEQKLFSAEMVLQTLLRQCWFEPEYLDAMLSATTMRSFAGALRSMKLFGGALQFTHALEFLLTWDVLAKHKIFTFSVPPERPRQKLDSQLRHGTNSTVFLNLVGCHLQRSQGHPQSFGAIAKAVRQLLPRRIRFAEHVVDMPEIEAIDASSNACQAVAVLQTYLTSKFAGKQRACFSDPDGRGFSGFMPPL